MLHNWISLLEARFSGRYFRFILAPDPNLILFADDFYEEEKTVCTKLSTKSAIPLFKVKVLYNAASEKETILFHDATKTAGDLQNEVHKKLTQMNKSFAVPKNIRFHYMGTESADPLSAQELEPALKLDS